MAVTPELVIIGAAAGIATLAVIAVRRAGERPYDATGPLISAAERRLLEGLQKALAPDFVVFPRPRLSDVVHVRRRVRGKRRRVALARIADASVGIAVCAADDLRVRALVELDERARAGHERRARDQVLDSVLGAARLPLVRIPPKDAYDAADLRAAVLSRLREIGDDLPADRTVAEGAGPAGVVVRGASSGDAPWARLGALGRAAVARLQRRLPGRRTLAALVSGSLAFVLGAGWLLTHGPSSRPPATRPVAVQSPAPAENPGPTLRETLDSLLKRSAGDRPKAATADPALATPPTTAAPAERPREIVGWKEEKVPGKPLEQCLGPDNEINPEVVRCRTGYSQRVPVYR